MAILQPGERAPAFTLESRPGERVSLADFRGKPLVLFFYPADFSPVCGDQTVLYNEVLPDITDLGAQILGVSVDGPWCHQAYAERQRLRYPLLADFEPKGAVARQYGAYRAADGVSERAIFVIDPAGVIRWSHCADIGINPGADGILSALEELRDERR